MMFLKPDKLCQKIGNEEAMSQADLVIYITLWCFYGYKGGKPWAAVSVRRGLCLIAQLLRLVDEDTEAEHQAINRIDKIKIIIKRHLGAAEVLGYLSEVWLTMWLLGVNWFGHSIRRFGCGRGQHAFAS